jgi:hypothetical protein
LPGHSDADGAGAQLWVDDAVDAAEGETVKEDWLAGRVVDERAYEASTTAGYPGYSNRPLSTPGRYLVPVMLDSKTQFGLLPVLEPR